MAETFSLLDEIRRGKYDVSVTTTFNIFFPFYEEVVLPHLQNSGCRQNLLLIDAVQCAAEMARTSTRPRLAGREYTLLPIAGGGAFHPKLLLLVGKEQGLLLVGSHNLTLAGFSSNRELTNRFELAGRHDQEAVATFKSAWQFIRSWAGDAPETIDKSLRGIESHADWLCGIPPTSSASPFVGSTSTGPSLWERVKPMVPQKVRRITVVGPFFDREMAFVKRLKEEFAPSELIVGLEAETASITRQARKLLPQARFVPADNLGETAGYLHAKALLFECADESEVLVTGSANPSRPAWMAPPGERNAEAVIVRKSGKKNSTAGQLGLKRLARLKELTEDAWGLIESRAQEPRKSPELAHAPLLAVSTGEGVEVFNVSPTPKLAAEASLIGINQKCLAVVAVGPAVDGRLFIRIADVAAVKDAALIEFRTAGGRNVFAIVHHADELASLARTDRERALRQALSTLESGTPMIEELMRLVEKVIFDDVPEVDVADHVRRTTQKAEAEKEGGQGSFSVDIEDVRGRRKRRRELIASGDLGALLDALIHRLGVGLEGVIRTGPAAGRSEGDLTELEDDAPSPPREVDGVLLAQNCRRKLRKLLRRMVKQLEVTAARREKPVRAVVQAAAVLGLTHRLAGVGPEDAPWVPAGETLVPRDELADFFMDAGRLLYSKRDGVLAAALAELGGAECAEVSLLRGLLLWLAWELDLDVRDVLGWEDSEEVELHLRGLARLLLLGPDIAGDEEASSRAREAIKGLWSKYYYGEFDPEWLDSFMRWAKGIARLRLHPPKGSVVGRMPEAGDIVFPLKSSAPDFFVVMESAQNRLRLIDLDSVGELKAYATNFFAVAVAGDG